MRGAGRGTRRKPLGTVRSWDPTCTPRAVLERLTQTKHSAKGGVSPGLPSGHPSPSPPQPALAIVLRQRSLHPFSMPRLQMTLSRLRPPGVMSHPPPPMMPRSWRRHANDGSSTPDEGGRTHQFDPRSHLTPATRQHRCLTTPAGPRTQKAPTSVADVSTQHRRQQLRYHLTSAPTLAPMPALTLAPTSAPDVSTYASTYGSTYVSIGTSIYVSTHASTTVSNNVSTDVSTYVSTRRQHLRQHPRQHSRQHRRQHYAGTDSTTDVSTDACTYVSTYVSTYASTWARRPTAAAAMAAAAGARLARRRTPSRRRRAAAAPLAVACCAWRLAEGAPRGRKADACCARRRPARRGGYPGRRVLCKASRGAQPRPQHRR